MDESDYDTNDSSALRDPESGKKPHNRSRCLTKKWTQEEARLMVDLVREKEALWNSNLLAYKNVEYRRKCWEEIAQKTDHSVSDAKIYWNTVKSRYNYERKRMESNKSYKPTFDLLNSLEFLSSIAIKTKYTKPRQPVQVVNKADFSDNTDELPSMNAVWLESADSNSDVKVFNNYNENVTGYGEREGRERKRMISHSPSPSPIRNSHNHSLISTHMSECLSYSTNQQDAAARDRWKKVFAEYIYCELDRYDYQQAQDLKSQLTMVCVNFSASTPDAQVKRRKLNSTEQ